MPPVSGSTTGPGFIPTASAQVGLNWALPLYHSRLNLALGYGVDAWWFIALGDKAKDNALFKNIDRLSHGPFFNCRFDF
jgi:hypothetical protein